MIRTHILPCRLPRADADALNRESGRISTEVLVWHYRIYRRTRRWLSPQADERLNDSFGPTTLHAHRRDAAQRTKDSCGAKPPHNPALNEAGAFRSLTTMGFPVGGRSEPWAGGARTGGDPGSSDECRR